MKSNPHLAGGNREHVENGAAKPAQQTDENESPVSNGVPKRFRRLKGNELVCHGDFVTNNGQGFEPWEGPNGFRADAYVKPIYRRQERRPAGTKKSP